MVVERGCMDRSTENVESVMCLHALLSFFILFSNLQ